MVGLECAVAAGGVARLTRVELDPSTGGGLQAEVDLWARGGRGKRPGLAAEQG